MALSFSEFFRDNDWVGDLRKTYEDRDYYRYFNEQLYGEPFDYEDVAVNLPEYAEMMGETYYTEARNKKLKDNEAKKPWTYENLQKKLHQQDPRLPFAKHNKRDNPITGIPMLSAGDTNPKTAKGYPGKVKNPHTGKPAQMMNAVMHLLPAGFSGCNTCKQHTPECAASCLDVSGTSFLMAGKTSGRAKRTFMFAYHKNAALQKLAGEIDKQAAKAHDLGFNFGTRLNGTSDIDWEDPRYWFKYKRRYSKDVGQGRNCPPGDGKKSVFCHFPEIQFYDYTKSYTRAMEHAQGKMPRNYHLTFSYSEKTQLGKGQMEKLLQAGSNIAVVFAFAEKNYDMDKANKKGWKKDTKNKELVSEAGPYKLPKKWRGESGATYDIISGDIHDLRFIDEMHKRDKRGVIVGLAAKGDAKFIKSVLGNTKQMFVVQPDDPHIRYEEENSDWVKKATEAHPKRLKDTEARKQKELRDIRALADDPRVTPDEKIKLLKIASDLEQGQTDYTGPGGQRKRSNDIYNTVKSELGTMRYRFKGHISKALDKEIAAAERRDRKAAKTEKREWEPWSDERKDAYRRQKLTPPQDPREKAAWVRDHDYFGLDDLMTADDHGFDQKDGKPHWQADDPAKAPNTQPSSRLQLGMDRLKPTELSGLEKHIMTHKDRFEKLYDGPESGPAASRPETKPSIVGTQRRTRLAQESDNPYLSPMLEMVG